MIDWIVSALLVASGVAVLNSAVGLLRLPDFFLRMHAPAVAYTFACWSVALASLLHFSSRGQGLSLHVWLVILVLAVTAPVSTVLLARAALFRQRRTGEALPPPLGLDES